MSTTVLLGTSTADITPQKPVPLSGFGFRTGNFDSVRGRLNLRCFIFRYPEYDIVVFSADILCWGRDTVANCKALLEKNYPDAKRSCFLFLATHTHCAPSVTYYLAQGLGGADREYVALVEQKILETVKDASLHIRPVRGTLYEGKTAIAINRRLKTDRGWIMAPNPAGPKNDDIRLMEFIAAQPDAEFSEGQPVAVWACASCHPTASGENRVDREFFARGLDYYLEDTGATGAFIQGCCGDVRPALVKDGEFFRGSLDLESEELARRFADELHAAKKNGGTPLQFNTPPQFAIEDLFRSSAAELPFNPDFPHKNRSALVSREDHLGEWARRFMDSPVPPSMTLNLRMFNLSREFAFIFLSGEIVSEYSLYCKEISRGQVWAGAYADGMTTYIPTAAQLTEGGYEPYEAMFYLMQSAPFAESAETVLKKKIFDLVTKRK